MLVVIQFCSFSHLILTGLQDLKQLRMKTYFLTLMFGSITVQIRNLTRLATTVVITVGTKCVHSSAVVSPRDQILNLVNLQRHKIGFKVLKDKLTTYFQLI